MFCVKFGWNWLCSGDKDFYKFHLCISTIFYHLPLEKGLALHLNKFVNSLNWRMLCAKFGWHWLRGSGEKDFQILSMHFRYFVIISPWERAWSFIWRNFNPLYPRMSCAKFGWNWPCGSGERTKMWKVFEDKFQSQKFKWVFD